MSTQVSAPVRPSRPWLIGLAVATVLAAFTGALWVHFGTTVFYEMVLAGIAACL